MSSNSQNEDHRLIPADLKAKMIQNHYDVTERGIEDHPPVVMLTTLTGNAAWLLSEIDPYYEDVAFGLCDPGLGTPELGTVSISELDDIKWPGKEFPMVVRDADFVPSYPMSVYYKAALMCQQITVDPDQLAQAAKLLKSEP